MHRSEKAGPWSKPRSIGQSWNLRDSADLPVHLFPLTSRNTRALLTPDGLTVIIQSNGTAPSYCWNHVYVSFDPDHCGGQLIAINCDHTRTISKYL